MGTNLEALESVYEQLRVALYSLDGIHAQFEADGEVPTRTMTQLTKARELGMQLAALIEEIEE